MTTVHLHVVLQCARVQPRADFSSDQIKARQAECDDCLRRNLQHPHVHQVHVLLEHVRKDTPMVQRVVDNHCEDDDNSKNKLVLVPWNRRMTYADAFDYCNQHLTNNNNNNNNNRQLAVVMNADIYLGHGMDRLLQQCDQIFDNNTPTVLSLTRHEKGVCRHDTQQPPDTTTTMMSDTSSCGCPFFRRHQQTGSYHYFGSHDSVWFCPPIASPVIDACRHVLQNRWGAEHAVIRALLATSKNYYRMANPSVDIRTFHHHKSDLHPWRSEPGGCQVLAHPHDHPPLPPTTLEEWWTTSHNPKMTDDKLLPADEKQATLLLPDDESLVL